MLLSLLMKSAQQILLMDSKAELLVGQIKIMNLAVELLPHLVINSQAINIIVTMPNAAL